MGPVLALLIGRSWADDTGCLMSKGQGMRLAAQEMRERREAMGKGWSVLRDRDARIRMMGGK